MIADLAMYDWPRVRAANDAYWSEVARRLVDAGIDAPAGLARHPDVEAVWRHPDLLIAQTCGMPYISGHCGSSVLVGRPDYGLAGARDGSYRSAIVGRRDMEQGAGPEALLACTGLRVAVNGWDSYSGHVALRAHLADLRDGASSPFFGDAIISGSHLFSARMVAEGAAEVAALDWVAWELLQLHEPVTAGRLSLIDQTADAPALPFITSPAHAGFASVLADALDAAARVLPPATGVPRGVGRTVDADFGATRSAAGRAAREKFAPNAPDLPAIPEK